MKRIGTTCVMALVALFAGASVHAQTPQTTPTPQAPTATQEATPAQPSPDQPRHRHQQRSIEERFKKLDQNGDGHVTREEWPRPKAFDRLDLNHDGVLTLDELTQARMEQHHGYRVEAAATRGEQRLQ